MPPMPKGGRHASPSRGRNNFGTSPERGDRPQEQPPDLVDAYDILGSNRDIRVYKAIDWYVLSYEADLYTAALISLVGHHIWNNSLMHSLQIYYA